MAIPMTPYGISHEEAHMIRMPETSREQALRNKAAANLIDSVKELLRAEISIEVEGLEKRIIGGAILVDGLREQLGAVARELTASQENNGVLTRLVVRMGRDLEHLGMRYDRFLIPSHVTHGPPWEPINSGYPYTVIGQREWQADQHEEEGPDVRREDCVP